MGTLSLQNLNHKRYFIRLNTGAADLDSSVRIALDAASPKIDADVAVVYVLNQENAELNAVARRTALVARVPDVGATLSDKTVQWLENLRSPAQGKPSHDPFFEKLPEAIQHRLERVLLAPLRGAEELLGILTIGRSGDRIFDEEEVRLAQRSAHLLAAVLERDALRQKLAERKLVERAKGILQQKRRVSEEQAYHILRNASRRRRQPMAELAREIIETQLLSTLVRRSGAA